MIFRLNKGLIIPAILTVLLLFLIGTNSAHAAKLMIEATATWWAHLVANLLLFLHIGGGAVGLVAGTVAIMARLFVAPKKPTRVHSIAGRAFFVSMFISYAIGALVAPFLHEGQRPNFVAGVLALYLLITAWLAAKRVNPVVGRTEKIGLAVALSVFTAGVLFMLQAANDPSGTVDGSPPQAFVLFVVVAGAAALGDVRAIMRGTINGATRIARHVWRMCVSLFIASASFFFGQQQLLPEAMLGTLWQYGPVLFPLIAMLVGLLALPLSKRRRVALNH